MRHILLILTLLGLTAGAGCRMCAHPFDYCGPTYVGECGTVCCDPDARAGSVLSPPLDTTAVPEMIVDESSELVEEVSLPISQAEKTTKRSKTRTARVVPIPAPPRKG
ncbi:MAG: hypothetical protein JW888_15365 [Pirellulales bacterium]|nr:hypothetical protein [Pirellulales bacterium]